MLQRRGEGEHGEPRDVYQTGGKAKKMGEKTSVSILFAGTNAETAVRMYFRKREGWDRKKARQK